MKIIEIVNRPYPQTLNRWKICLLVSLFISLFLVLFQPFGLQFIEINSKILVLIGYGAVTYVLLVFNLIVLPKLMAKSFVEKTWTIKKQVYWLSLIVVSISVGNYLYSVIFSIFPWIGLKGFLIFIAFTFPIAIIPVTFVTFITQYIYLKRNIASSTLINNALTSTSTKENDFESIIAFSSGNQNHQIKLRDFIYLESEGNYVNVYYMNAKNLKCKLIRNTLKNLESEINFETIFKCHRAFMINLQYIEKVKGNSQGYSLVLRNVDKELPVSRSNTKAFKEKIISYGKI